jgi:hypothetical protein
MRDRPNLKHLVHLMLPAVSHESPITLSLPSHGRACGLAVPSYRIERCPTQVAHAVTPEMLNQEGLSPEGQKLLFVREKLAKELDAALEIRSRYEAFLDDPESATDDRINKKYKAASKEVRPPRTGGVQRA